MSDQQKKLSNMLRKSVVAVNKLKQTINQLEHEKHEPIAIIGMACRFADGIETIEQYWQALIDKRDTIHSVPIDRWDKDALYDSDKDTAGKMNLKRIGSIQNLDQFDPEFFEISPREAVDMDPQHRLLLEVSWEALEDAAIPSDSLFGSNTGVFTSILNHDYSDLLLMQGQERYANPYSALSYWGCIAAGRISYFLGLQGPNVAIDTGCSASIISLHDASNSLRNRECDLAIAGGAHVVISPERVMNYCRVGVLSPSGACRSFSDDADGFAKGDGCGMLVLKRLSDAINNDDRIYAVIPGSAINHDGASAGLTVPNGPAQEKVIRAALKRSNLSPSDIDFIEAHGTGTPLGDPIEFRALNNVFKGCKDTENPLLVGSVKTNLGHLESAAGVASIIKVILALQHDLIPPQIHFSTLNKMIELDVIPAEILTEAVPLDKKPDSIRAVGISSFSLSGSNAHMIITDVPTEYGEHMEPIEATSTKEHHVITLSAKTPDSLSLLIGKYIDFIDENTAIEIGDLAYTTNIGRTHFEHRISVVVRSLSELKEALINNNYLSGNSSENKNLKVSMSHQERRDYIIQDIGKHKRQIELGSDVDWLTLLNDLSELYISGAAIDWKTLYTNFAYRKISLPSYAFTRKRYWSKLLEHAGVSVDQYRYIIKWEISSSLPSVDTSKLQGNWLLMSEDDDVSRELNDQLTESPVQISISSLEKDDIDAAVIVFVVPKKPNIMALTKKFFTLLKSLAAKNHNVSLIVITHDLFIGDIQEDQLATAPLIGMLKSAVNENPHITGKIIDFRAADKLKPKIENILKEIIYADSEDQVAYKNNTRYLPRLTQGQFEQSKPITLDSDACYLITGGMGDLGSQVASWFAKQGAKHLLLTTHREVDSTVTTEFKKKFPDDCDVDFLLVDLTIDEQVKKMMEKIASLPHPLKGIVHTAGTIKDMPVSEMSWEDMEFVFKPKITAVSVLDRLCEQHNLALDFFILFSSIASVMGTIGQVNYAGANAYLDFFSQYRRARGEAALSIGWGPWSQLGMAQELLQLHGSMGLDGLTTQEGMAAFAKVFSEQGHVLVSNFNWQNVFAKNLFRTMLIENFKPESKSEPQVKQDFSQRLPGLPEAEQQSIITETITEELRAVLELPADKTLSLNQHFSEFGLDSILAVELRNRLQQHLANLMSLNINDLFSHSNLAELSLYLSQTMQLKPASIKPELKSKWLINLPATQPIKSRLICIPHGGSGTSVFQGWRKQLADDVELCLLELPGRETRVDEPLMQNYDRLLFELLQAVSNKLDFPYILFGHSLGGLLAADLAALLCALDYPPPSHLIISGVRPMSLLKADAAWFKSMLDGDDQTFVDEVKEMFPDYPATTDPTSPLTDILRADYQLIYARCLKADPDPINVSLTTITAEADTYISQGGMERWGAITSAELDHQIVPGQHLSIVSNPQPYIDIIKKWL